MYAVHACSHGVLSTSHLPYTTIREPGCWYHALTACLAGLPFPSRHPLDQQNTSFIRSLPGLELLAKTLMGAVPNVLRSLTPIPWMHSSAHLSDQQHY